MKWIIFFTVLLFSDSYSMQEDCAKSCLTCQRLENINAILQVEEAHKHIIYNAIYAVEGSNKFPEKEYMLKAVMSIVYDNDIYKNMSPDQRNGLELFAYMEIEIMYKKHAEPEKTGCLIL